MAYAGSAAIRTALLLLTWWALTEGDPAATGFGLGAAPLVALLSLRFFPPSPLRPQPVATLVFSGYFFLRSVAAGVDVARRLLSPRLPISPGYVSYTTSLPAGSPRWLLANTLSLLPGTLSVTLHGRDIELHCLDTTMPVSEDVARTELRIARMFPQ
ncbi:Na+/H+ antiporter subunit E [Haliea sp. E1-2-M8]|uniref:Na+/H+ antiporter subunit E n=1 Tax=Haliea sp. E1-2-M8 TaxID=3064706 RepID=UPI00271880AA|nr:Na+/H+ antiporter subunit E [Haliea sp. E1-2-M8]MDO8863102.1 Na+/H+ antiporter subunit E [Haliea sp. E1-2-M8]